MLDFFSSKIRQPAECSITIDGQSISHLYPYLIEVRAERLRSGASSAVLTFETRRNEYGEWAVQDDELIFQTWRKIKIEAHFGTRSEEVFAGYTIQLKADYPAESAASRVIVECRDASILLDRMATHKVWEASDDQTIVAAIAKEYQLKASGANAKGQESKQLLQNATPWNFLLERAAANEFDLRVENNEIYFGPMKLDGDIQPDLLVYAGNDTSCRQLSVNVDGHWPEKLAIFPNPKSINDKDKIVVSPTNQVLGKTRAENTAAGLPDFAWVAGSVPNLTKQQLIERAQQTVNKHSMRIKAEGELDGTRYGHVLEVGLVGVDGLGTRLDGVYFVDQVQHSFTANGYTQTFKLLRNAFGDKR